MRGKKVITLEDTPPWGPRMKNPSTFPSHSPLPSEEKYDIKSSSEEKIPKRKEEKKKRKHRSTDKDEIKKAKEDSLQSEQDRLVRLQEMKSCAGSLKLVTIILYGDGDEDPPSDVPLSAPSTTGAIIAYIVPVADET
ncbi:hypothetical protein FXO37_31468 [Capsicum annuum]|nr:hypothetical protein FXO37_31468 [Capsicum annuum]